MSNSPLCKGCGKPIRGSYFLALGGIWHPEHFRCAACQRPILEATFSEYKGQAYHCTCYQELVQPRCAYCGGPLDQYQQDYWGTKFHAVHATEYPVCSFCGRLVPPRETEANPQSEGKIRCPSCRRSAIESMERAQPIFMMAFRWIVKQNMLFEGASVRLGLYRISELKAFHGEADVSRTLGATRHSWKEVNGIVVQREVNVAMLWGLPSSLFQGVAVHELGHAWLAIHNAVGLPDWANEGFCEFLAHRYYVDVPSVEANYYAKQIESDRSETYGGGFRRISMLAQSIGFAKLTQSLHDRGELPSI